MTSKNITVTINLQLTTSKIAGLLCVLLSIPLMFIDTLSAIMAMGIGSGLIGVKTVVQGINKRTSKENIVNDE